MMIQQSGFQTATPDSFKGRTWTLFLSGLLIFFLCIATLFTRPAVAGARYYFDGYLSTATQSSCWWTNPPTTDYQLRAYVGYYTDGSTFPKTGDVTYVHAVGSNISGCAIGETFGPQFFLPDGASFAVSATNPVYCWLSKLDGSITPYQVPNNSNGGCSQTASTGTYGGAFFGWAALPPGWVLEVQVPYVFNKKLSGLAGGTGAVLNMASTTVNSPGFVYPNQAVTVFYQAAFQNYANNSITSNSANLAFNLLSYYHGGQLYIDYGTTNPPPSNASSSSIAATSQSYPITSNLTGLNASTTYFWRARFVTSDGTFTSTTQSFTTSVQSGPQTLTVSKAGTGAGTVTSNPAGINCGATCSAGFTLSSGVTLTASPTAGSTFTGWSGGGCSGTATCTVTMSSAQTVTATFVSSGPQTLTVSKNGTGTGTVTSNPAGINCGATCSANFTLSSGVTLTASPTAGSMFTGWSGGGCSGTGTCTVTMNSALSVTATIMREIGSLSITLGGLPANSTALLEITGPSGLITTRNAMTGTGFNLSDVSTGTYTVTPPTVTIGGKIYTAPPQSVVVNFGTTATIDVMYRRKATDLTPILMLLLN